MWEFTLLNTFRGNEDKIAAMWEFTLYNTYV